MKSNEDYLDELLRSMNQETAEESPLTRFGLQDDSETSTAEIGKMDQAMIDALLADAAEEEPESEIVEDPISDTEMGKMDQAMIDALLAGAAEEAEAEERVEIGDTLDDLDPELRDQFITYEDWGEEIETEVPGEITAEDSILPDMPVEEKPFTDMLTEVDTNQELDDTEEASMLAQLLAEMQEEASQSGLDSLDDVELLDEESIDALLSAAKESANNLYEEQPVSFDMSDDGNMAEIDAMLGITEGDEALEEDSTLLRMLEEAEAVSDSFLGDENEIMEVDEAELDAILSGVSNSSVPEKEEKSKKKKKREKKEKVKKEKKASGLKPILDKIISILMEEVPDDDISGEDGLNLSDENKNILNELDQEETKKIKVKEKKKEKKEKKPKKEKTKKEKPKKEKKPKKQKEPKASESLAPEKRIPRKKIIVTSIFAFSVLALILLVEVLVPPMLTQSRARSAYDKGDYYEAYKEYYGQKLSEEDEIRFQGAKTILRMQSNLDGYSNYLKMNKEVKALHSLLEGVKVKFDVFMKAEEYNVLSQVSAVYEQILEVLNSKYHLSEEDALELTEEKSDAVYTRKLEALVEGKPYSGDSDNSDKQMNREDMLPEEEAIFHN